MRLRDAYSASIYFGWTPGKRSNFIGEENRKKSAKKRKINSMGPGGKEEKSAALLSWHSC